MSNSTIKAEFNKSIRRDDDLKLLLAKKNDVKVSTIDRWLREDDVMLTTAMNLNILKEHFQVLETEELLDSSVLKGA